MSIKWLQTTTTNESLSYLQKFQIIIDGYEYTAVQDRRYSFETTSPSRIIQSGFDYSGHSVVQPATVSYTIIVSKYDRAELNRLLELQSSRKPFKLVNPVYVIQSCILTSISITDESIDVLKLGVSFQELNGSISETYTDTSDLGFQMFSDRNLGSRASQPDESTTFNVDKSNTVETYEEIQENIPALIEPETPIKGDIREKFIIDEEDNNKKYVRVKLGSISPIMAIRQPTI